MHATTIIAYTFDADCHCEECTVGYVLATDPDARGDRDAAEEALSLGIAEDSEGNEIRPVFASDEWFDVDSGECESLFCGDCGDELDIAHAADCEEVGGENVCPHLT